MNLTSEVPLLELTPIERVKAYVALMKLRVVELLLITTVRENTYLGKHVPAAASFAPHKAALPGFPEASLEAREPVKQAAPVIPATIEEMDKSIDDMVKEA